MGVGRLVDFGLIDMDCSVAIEMGSQRFEFPAQRHRFLYRIPGSSAAELKDNQLALFYIIKSVNCSSTRVSNLIQITFNWTRQLRVGVFLKWLAIGVGNDFHNVPPRAVALNLLTLGRF